MFRAGVVVCGEERGQTPRAEVVSGSNRHIFLNGDPADEGAGGHPGIP
jgi:hypothetical protein